MTYTKLDALRILSNAHWYVADSLPEGVNINNDVYDATEILDRAFGYVRRSLRMSDLFHMPSTRSRIKAEGFNGRMPTYF